VLAVCTFTVGAGAPAAATTGTSLLDASADGTGDTITNLIPNTQITEGTLTIP